MNAAPWPDISAGIASASGAPFAIESLGAVGGGYARQAQILIDRLLPEI